MIRTARSVCSLLALAVLVATPFASRDAHALDIEFIELFWLFDRSEGVPISNPYGMEIVVEGSDIDSIQVVTPGTAGTFNLTLISGQEWEIPGTVTTSFANSTDLLTAFAGGTYTFNIIGDSGATEDTFSRTYSPTVVSSFLDVSAPTSSSPFPTDGTVTWADCSGCDGTLLVGFIDADDTDIDSFSDTDKTRTTWNPSGLQAGQFYQAEMILGDYDFFDQSTTTDGQNDPITHTGGFENINVIQFQTLGAVPSLGQVGLGVLFALLALSGSARPIARSRSTATRGGRRRR